MSLILTAGRCESDAFTRVGDDDALPADATPVLVSQDRWQRDRDLLRQHSGPTGVWLTNTAEVAALAGHLDGLALIELSFPSFADGRAYSQARLLRGRLGYHGPLRASGSAVVLDQIASLHRCGFDQFALRDDQDAEACLAALAALTLAYQPAEDGLASVRRRRQCELTHS